METARLRSQPLTRGVDPEIRQKLHRCKPGAKMPIDGTVILVFRLQFADKILRYSINRPMCAADRPPDGAGSRT